MSVKFQGCQACDKQDSCLKPCPALGAELSEVTVTYQRELTIGSPEYSKIDLHSIVRISPLSPRERIYLTLHVGGYRQTEIAKMFGITRHSVCQAIYSARKKIRSNVQ